MYLLEQKTIEMQIRLQRNNVSSEEITEILLSKEASIMLTVLASSHCNADHLRLVAADPNHFIRVSVIKHPNIPEDIQNMYLGYDTYTKQLLALHGNLTKNVIDKLLDEKDVIIRKMVMQNKNMSESNLLKALKDKDISIRKEAAMHINGTHNTVDEALNDAVTSVRKVAMLNKNATIDNIKKALTDVSPAVKMYGYRNPNITMELKNEAIKDPDIMYFLLKKS